MSLWGWNIVLYVARGSFGILFIMPISVSLIGSIRGLLPFSGVTFTLFRVKSMSIGCSCVSSPILMPVSFMVRRIAPSIFPHDAIKRSISCSVGMNGSRSFGVYFGAFHLMFLCLR